MHRLRCGAVWELVLSGAIGLLGVGIGYVFVNWTAKKQRLYEIKQQAYGAMFPRLNELIGIVKWLHDGEGLKLEDQELLPGTLVAMLIPPFVLADKDTVAELDEIAAEYEDKDSTSKKDRLAFLQAIQEKVRSMLTLEMYSIARDLRYELAPLTFIRPDPEVGRLRSQLFSMLQEDQTTLALRSLFKPTGLDTLIPKKDMAARLAEYGKVLEALQAAVQEDLNRTF